MAGKTQLHSKMQRKCFRVIYNLVIEDSESFVQLLKVPNLCDMFLQGFHCQTYS